MNEGGEWFSGPAAASRALAYYERELMREAEKV